MTAYDNWATASPPDGPEPCGWCAELSNGEDDAELYVVTTERNGFEEVVNYDDLRARFEVENWQTMAPPPGLDPMALASIAQYPGYALTGRVADLYREGE